MFREITPTRTHLVNQLETGLVLLSLVRELDADRGEGWGGGGDDDGRRGGEGGSLCARGKVVYTRRDRRARFDRYPRIVVTHRFDLESIRTPAIDRCAKDRSAIDRGES